MSSLSEVRATVVACEATCEAAKAETAAAYRALVELADVRRAVIAGDLPGDVDLCLWNEGAARVRYGVAIDAEQDARVARDDAYDWENDCLGERVPDGLGAYAD